MVEYTRALPSHIRLWRDSTPVVGDDGFLGKALHGSRVMELCTLSHLAVTARSLCSSTYTKHALRFDNRSISIVLIIMHYPSKKRSFRVFYMPFSSDCQWGKWGERIAWPVQRVPGFTGVRQCLASGQQYESSAQGVTHSAPTSTHNLVRGQQACLSEHTCPNRCKNLVLTRDLSRIVLCTSYVDGYAGFLPSRPGHSWRWLAWDNAWHRGSSILWPYKHL